MPFIIELIFSGIVPRKRIKIENKFWIEIKSIGHCSPSTAVRPPSVQMLFRHSISFRNAPCNNIVIIAFILEFIVA